MKLSKTWTTVTPLSKIIAFCLFIALPFLGFYLGYSVKKPDVTPNIVESKEATLPSPEEVTQKFYSWYLNCLENHWKNPEGKSPDESCPLETSALVGEQLAQTHKAGKVSVLCSQNTPASFTVDKTTIDGDTASVTVNTFYSSSGINPTNIILKRNQQRWQIADITCSF